MLPVNLLHILLLQLQRASTTEEFRELLDSDEYDFRYLSGVGQPSCSVQLKDRD